MLVGTSNTILIFIAFPWLRDVPEGISRRQLVSAIRSKRVSARAARLGLLDLLAITGPCPVPIGQCAEPRPAVTLSHRRSYPDRRPFVLVHYVPLRMRAPGGSIAELFDNVTTLTVTLLYSFSLHSHGLGMSRKV
jgi:hypothetical protein